VPVTEVLPDIENWKSSLGKWTRTIEALYKLCTSEADWANVKLEPTEKRVLKKKAEELYAQIKAPTPGCVPLYP
jgi:hypothetical protein